MIKTSSRIPLKLMAAAEEQGLAERDPLSYGFWLPAPLLLPLRDKRLCFPPFRNFSISKICG